jgi:hypothetical protein
VANPFQRIERDVKYAYFQVNGFDYRTDGQSVQANDGSAQFPSWHTTGSLPIVLKAREVWKAERQAA